MHATEKMQETAPRGAETRPDSDVANAQFSVKLNKDRMLLSAVLDVLYVTIIWIPHCHVRSGCQNRKA
ncbi:uncharacterized protein RCO7_14337 [Rhynchosporium graminicola]|uniref:Uncharacterized protein n=1 Tax=Rhynchosporium graminicola TaxID=2792576 RepID=A0A1E1KDW1_9HELO|nr:uncharacterized protein RCO7_14337 [Rhynchosporium commune]